MRRSGLRALFKGGIEGRLGVEAGGKPNFLQLEVGHLGQLKLAFHFLDAVRIDEVEEVLLALLVDNLREVVRRQPQLGGQVGQLEVGVLVGPAGGHERAQPVQDAAGCLGSQRGFLIFSA